MGWIRDNISAAELDEWRHIAMVDPIGSDPLYIAAGLIRNTICAAQGWQEGIVDESDFIPKFERISTRPIESASHEELIEQGKNFARRFGGIVNE